MGKAFDPERYNNFLSKDFAKACYTVRRKGLATNHFTTNLQR